MTLGTDLALTGNLILTDGILNTGANTLSLSPASAASRTSGYVNGNLQKSFGVSGNLGSFSFPLGTANAYSPLDANVTANSNGTLTATAIQGKLPNISGANALQRYWTLSGSGITANLTFHYRGGNPTAGDVVGNEANYKIFKYDGAFTQFTPDATGSNSASDHFATLNNISSFSDWTLAEPGVVNPGTVAFVGAPYTTPEGSADHDVTITVARSGGTDGALDVTYATSNGTATAASDYLSATGTLHWDNGEAGNKTFLITVKGDTTYEANETVTITLSDATDGALIGGPNPATLTITNDDNPPATLVVNTTNDVDDGVCDATHCSLREAIDAANFSSDTSTINFMSGLTGTITLTSALANLSTPMSINGPDASVITVSGNNAVRVFFVTSTVSISGLTIANGAGGGGSGVLSTSGGNVTLTNIYFTANDGPGAGGALFNSATMTIIGCTFTLNTGNGGAALSSNGTTTMINSTVSGNNSNISGPVYATSGTLNIVNSTITNNTSDTGGGIRNVGATINLRNTIVAGNSVTSTGPDVHGSFNSQGHNLIGKSDGSAGFTDGVNGDQVGTIASPKNPMLDALGNYGGPTQTHRLQSGSSAIDAADNCVVNNTCTPTPYGFSLTTDQRGAGFPRQVDGNNDGTAQVDIGAYEAPTCTPPVTPTASNGGPYCEGATIQLSTPTVAGATYSWTGPNGFTSSTQNPTRANATTADAGTYSVTITVNGCTSSAGSTNVVVNPTPATPTASNGGPYCEGATISLSTPTVAGATYSWTGPNGFTSSTQNPTRTNATTADTGTYSVTVTVNGCTSAAGTTSVVVNATPATPTASNGGPYCEGATISLSTPTVAGATYSWTGPNGFTSSTQNPTRTNATTADAGTYSVTVTVNGCTSAAGSTNVVVNPTPATPTASNGGPYCEGATISLSTPTVAGATYSWTGPNGFTSSTQNPTRTNATTADAGTYSVTVTVNGCTSAAGSTNVVVNPTPATPTASNGGPYCEGATISLSTPTVRWCDVFVDGTKRIHVIHSEPDPHQRDDCRCRNLLGNGHSQWLHVGGRNDQRSRELQLRQHRRRATADHTAKARRLVCRRRRLRVRRIRGRDQTDSRHPLRTRPAPTRRLPMPEPTR
jgi:CSLREA domain-containing protein